MDDIVIVKALRTAVGTIGGTLKNVQPDALATFIIKSVLERAGLEPAAVDEVIFGHARQSSDAANIARVAALRAGIPESSPAYTVMRQCASGMTAVCNAAMSIASGENEIIVAGGVESMSLAPFYMRGARFGLGTGTTELLDSITEAQYRSQPEDIYGRFNMGMTAENVAERMGISREDQDAFAFLSQRKAADAIAQGKFKDEIVPLELPQRKGEPIVFATDEHPRRTTFDGLAKLKPVFRTDGKGTVTAGNASGRNDGSSAVIVMSAKKAASLKLKPMAVIRGFATAGVDPRYMGLGPVAATEKVLKRTGLTLDQMELIELNEAFAAQSLGCIREMKLTDRLDIINVNGGAIALGHPIGNTGCRIIVTLLHEMEKRNSKLGLATLCVAGGMGAATILERV